MYTDHAQRTLHWCELSKSSVINVYPKICVWSTALIVIWVEAAHSWTVAAAAAAAIAAAAAFNAATTENLQIFIAIIFRANTSKSLA